MESVGDYVSIGNNFNALNQGQWQIISVSATSFSIANAGAVAEGPILLGSGFAGQINIYSGDGVQVGDTLVISGGFSPVSQGSYVLTSVTNNQLQFCSTVALPTEGPIMTEAIAIYFEAKELIYMEVSQECTVTVNGSESIVLKPLSEGCCNGSAQPGMLLLTDTIYSLGIESNGLVEANIYMAAVE